ncbi:SRPBCC family protein [Nocardioides sp. NBC_00163]|jgi:uncharacterized protein YndB with AHSA1/START domain|uniref:SRPBCC family protein n=1 Tax=unclassified Nocardioides TaxID=2615069 RepID=UPI0032470308
MSTPPFIPADHLGAVNRALTTTTRGGEELRVLVVERSYDADPDEVWDALTTKERIPRWLMPVTGDFEVGGRYQLEGNAGGEILACDRPKLLSITWAYGDMMSWVDATLTASGGRTLLRLEHSAPVPPEQWKEFGPSAVGIGWEQMLLGLALHLSAPEAEKMDPMSPDALPAMIEHTKGSAAAWVEADIAFGTSPDQARAAGERCVAAYTAMPD